MLYPIRKILYQSKLLKFSRLKIEQFYVTNDRQGLWLTVYFGIPYYKRLAIFFLGELSNEKDFEELMDILKNQKELRTNALIALLKIIKEHQRPLSILEENVINSNIHLLDELFRPEGDKKKENKSKNNEPIMFEKPRHKWMDHIWEIHRNGGLY